LNIFPLETGKNAERIGIELPLPSKRFILCRHEQLSNFNGNDRQQKQHFLREK